MSVEGKNRSRFQGSSCVKGNRVRIPILEGIAKRPLVAVFGRAGVKSVGLAATSSVKILWPIYADVAQHYISGEQLYRVQSVAGSNPVVGKVVTPTVRVVRREGPCAGSVKRQGHASSS